MTTNLRAKHLSGSDNLNVRGGKVLQPHFSKPHFGAFEDRVCRRTRFITRFAACNGADGGQFVAVEVSRAHFEVVRSRFTFYAAGIGTIERPLAMESL